MTLRPYKWTLWAYGHLIRPQTQLEANINLKISKDLIVDLKTISSIFITLIVSISIAFIIIIVIVVVIIVIVIVIYYYNQWLLVEFLQKILYMISV